MRVVLLSLVAISLITVGFGCSVARTPATYSLFAEVHANIGGCGDIPADLVVGESKATSIIGICTGDCSIDAAVKAGQIKRIVYIDYHSRGILGLWAETTTKVYGTK